MFHRLTFLNVNKQGELMKFFKLKDLVRSWSVQVWGATTALATIDF